MPHQLVVAKLDEAGWPLDVSLQHQGAMQERVDLVLMTRFAHIERNPEILSAKPIIRGTRIAVDLILEKVAAGETADDLMNDYPALTRESVAEALSYAAEAVREHAKDHPLGEVA